MQVSTMQQKFEECKEKIQKMPGPETHALDHVFVLGKNAQTALLFAGIAFLAVLIEINFAKEDLKNMPGDSVWWFFPHSWYAAKGLFLLFFLCIIVCYSTLGNRNQKTLGAMIALLGVVVLVGWYTEAEWITNTKNKT